MHTMQNRVARFIAAATLSLTLIGIGSVVAHADILPNGSPTEAPHVTVSGTTFYYTYNPIFDSGPAGSEHTKLKSGDYFTIYDFEGFKSVVSKPGAAGLWTYLLSATGPLGTPDPVDYPDSATIPNITFYYHGADQLTDGPLGAFVLESLYPISTTEIDTWGSKTTRTSNGKGKAEFTNILGPTSAVPEPGEYAFAGFVGLSLCGLVLRARRRSSKTIAANLLPAT